MTVPDTSSRPPGSAVPAWVAPAGTGELVVAVDTASLDEAMRLRDTLAGSVSFFKVGKELFTAAGPRAVAEFASVGRVFLDLKFHDIPATVAGAVRASAGVRSPPRGCARLRGAADDRGGRRGRPNLSGGATAPWRDSSHPFRCGERCGGVPSGIDRGSGFESFPAGPGLRSGRRGRVPQPRRKNSGHISATTSCCSSRESGPAGRLSLMISAEWPLPGRRRAGARTTSLSAAPLRDIATLAKRRFASSTRPADSREILFKDPRSRGPMHLPSLTSRRGFR